MKSLAFTIMICFLTYFNSVAQKTDKIKVRDRSFSEFLNKDTVYIYVGIMNRFKTSWAPTKIDITPKTGLAVENTQGYFTLRVKNPGNYLLSFDTPDSNRKVVLVSKVLTSKY